MPLHNRFFKVDVSDALTKVEKLRGRLSTEQFNLALRRTLLDTGRAVRKFVKAEIPKEYHANPTYVGRKVGDARPRGFLSYEVPIRGERGVIGGMFPAIGGGYATGAASRSGKWKKKLKKRAKIGAKILRAKASELPEKMTHQGGHPPFRLPVGVVLTRSASGRTVRVVGRSVPGMVDKQFENKIRKPINDYMVKRMEQQVNRLLGGK